MSALPLCWLTLCSFACASDTLELCDACAPGLEDAAPVEDAAIGDAGAQLCPSGTSPSSSVQLVGNSNEGWGSVVTSTATFVSTSAGAGRVSLGDLELRVNSDHPRLNELAGAVRVTMFRESAALIVYGWSAAIESVEPGRPIVVGWTSWKEQTMQAVLGRLDSAPVVRHQGQGCLLPDSCGDREALRFSVDLGDGSIDVPHRTRKLVGESEFTNGSSRAAPVETRCTDQSAYYEGSLIYFRD